MTWMKHKTIMVIERSQTQNTAYSWIPFIGNIQKQQETESRSMAAWAKGWGPTVNWHDGILSVIDVLILEYLW